MQCKELTDDECSAFRRLPCGFNDMVRAIYKAGWEDHAALIRSSTGLAGEFTVRTGLRVDLASGMFVGATSEEEE